MERRFFDFLAHLVVTLTLVSAGPLLKSHNPSGVAKARQQFGSGPIRVELKATNIDNRDLGIVLDTILDVKDFVRLVHAIAINHLDGIDLSDVRDKSKEKRNCHETHSLLEDEGDESHPGEMVFPNDNALAEFETRQELLAVASNLRKQPVTLKALTRHFNDIVRKVLTEILADLMNHSQKKWRYRTPSIRRQVTLVEEVAEVMKQTLVILRARPGIKKEITEEIPDLWDENFPRQVTRFNAENDPLSSLYEETKILRRLILQNSALCDHRHNQEEEPEDEEGSNDLNEAFEFFMSSSEHFKITDELQNCLKVVLDRIMKIHSTENPLDNQSPVDFQEQKVTNEGIKNNEKQYSEDKISESSDGISIIDQNKKQQNEQVTLSDSKSTASQKSKNGNVHAQEFQTPIDKDSEENLDEVLPKGKMIRDLEEERTTTKVVIIETLHGISPEYESHTVHVSTVERNETTIIPVTENYENLKTVEDIEEETNEDNDTTDLIFDTVVTEANKKKNDNDQSTDLSIDTIVPEQTERKADNNNRTDLSIDTIVTERNEHDLSIETTVNEGNEEMTKNNNPKHLSIDAIGIEGNEENIENNNPKGTSIDTIITEGNEETIENNKTKDLLINEIVTEGNNEKSENNTPNFFLFETSAPEHNSIEADDQTIFVRPKNESLRRDEEDTESYFEGATDLKPKELSSEDNEDELGSSTNHNVNTNINISTDHLRFPLRVRKNGRATGNVMESPDIPTTMRFGSDDFFNTKTHKKNNASAHSAEAVTPLERKSKSIVPSSYSSLSEAETSPGKETTLPPKKFDHPLARELVLAPKTIISNGTSVNVESNDSQLVENRKEDFIPLQVTRKSLGPSPDIPPPPRILKKLPDGNVIHEDDKEEQEKKKYIMDIILESINSIIADNATQRIESTDHGKSLRRSLLTWILSKRSC